MRDSNPRQPALSGYRDTNPRLIQLREDPRLEHDEVLTARRQAKTQGKSPASGKAQKRDRHVPQTAHILPLNRIAHFLQVAQGAVPHDAQVIRLPLPSFHVLPGVWLRNRVCSRYLVVRNRRVQSHCGNHAGEVTCRVCKRPAAKIIEQAPTSPLPRVQPHNSNRSAARVVNLAGPISTEHWQRRGDDSSTNPLNRNDMRWRQRTPHGAVDILTLPKLDQISIRISNPRITARISECND